MKDRKREIKRAREGGRKEGREESRKEEKRGRNGVDRERKRHKQNEGNDMNVTRTEKDTE